MLIGISATEIFRPSRYFIIKFIKGLISSRLESHCLKIVHLLKGLGSIKHNMFDVSDIIGSVPHPIIFQMIIIILCHCVFSNPTYLKAYLV